MFNKTEIFEVDFSGINSCRVFIFMVARLGNKCTNLFNYFI